MGLAERENLRKNSVINAMISEPRVGEASPQADIVIQSKGKSEARTKRVNLLVPPSLYADAQKKCVELGISFNECINQFLENWV